MNKVDFEKILHDVGMPISESEIQAEFKEDVLREDLITNTSKMSPFWRLMNAIITKPYIYLKDALVNEIMPNNFLLTATDVSLDLKGDEVNLKRKESSKAKGFITFVKTSESNDVIIKKGTIIQTPKINNKVYQLQTVQDVTIKAGTLSDRIEVEAVENGADHNLASNYYRILAEANPEIEEVYNDDNWISELGLDRESDDTFRERIRNQYNLVGHYHSDAVYKGLIVNLTGIPINQIFFKHDAPRGPGTANIYLLLNDGENSDEFIKQVNDFIMRDDHRGHGDDLECFAIDEALYDITATIHFNLSNYPSDLDAYLTAIEHFIRCAFRQNKSYDNVTKVNAYSRFSISNLDKELHSEFDLIESIEFNISDIVSELSVPRIKSLSVSVSDDQI